MFSQDNIIILWCGSHFPKWTFKVFRYIVNALNFPAQCEGNLCSSGKEPPPICLAKDSGLGSWGMRSSWEAGPCLWALDSDHQEGTLPGGHRLLETGNGGPTTRNSVMAEGIGVNY